MYLSGVTIKPRVSKETENENFVDKSLMISSRQSILPNICVIFAQTKSGWTTSPTSRSVSAKATINKLFLV